MSLRGLVAFGVLLGALVLGWLTWRDWRTRRESSSGGNEEAAAVTINKLPVAVANRTFDPTAPPAEMPPLRSFENAACDSDFVSSASVRGETRQRDSTHASVTIAQIKVTLGLHITIWVPSDVTQRVMEHEEGHRQISEYYYQTADKLAERIAARYMGRQLDISGSDLSAEANKMLGRMAAEITDEYNKELNPGPTQELYDAITDHGRNEVAVKDAVDHAIKNVAVESPEPVTNPGD